MVAENLSRLFETKLRSMVTQKGLSPKILNLVTQLHLLLKLRTKKVPVMVIAEILKNHKITFEIRAITTGYGRQRKNVYAIAPCTKSRQLFMLCKQVRQLLTYRKLRLQKQKPTFVLSLLLELQKNKGIIYNIVSRMNSFAFKNKAQVENLSRLF